MLLLVLYVHACALSAHTRVSICSCYYSSLVGCHTTVPSQSWDRLPNYQIQKIRLSKRLKLIEQDIQKLSTVNQLTALSHDSSLPLIGRDTPNALLAHWWVQEFINRTLSCFCKQIQQPSLGSPSTKTQREALLRKDWLWSGLQCSKIRNCQLCSNILDRASLHV